MLVYEQGNRVRVKNNTGKDITAGTIAKVGNWIGMAYTDIPNGQEGVLVIRGVVEAEVEDPTVEIATGTPLQFNPINGKVKPKTTEGPSLTQGNNNPVIGKAFETKPAGQAKVLVLLMPELY